MHRLADQVVKLTREHVTGEFSLIQTPGGFGTPPFGPRDAQVRVQGTELVVRLGEEERREPISTLRAAARLAADLLPSGLELDDEPLAIDPRAAAALADCYAFGRILLEGLRDGAPTSEDATEVTLWPEHFDIAIEMGEEGAGRRANYGLSPGDEEHEEPYVYVGPWKSPPSDPLWNAHGFPGAELSHSDLVRADDQLGSAREFCLARKRALDSAGSN